MTRLLFRGGAVFDPNADTAASADVVVENGRILDVGPGLDGDQAVDCSGLHLLPGLFDAHVHVMLSHIDMWRISRRLSPTGSSRPPET